MLGVEDMSMQMRCGPLISDRVVLSKHRHKDDHTAQMGRAHEMLREAREKAKRVEMVYRRV